MIFIAYATSHCAFSSNLFHGHFAQIYISQLSDPKNKKCNPWKVFGNNHPQILPLLSRRGPRGPEARLSQHYIGPKMTFHHFKSRRVWGWFVPKTFQGLHFLFSGSLSWSIYIWAICPWNKFDEKAQCEGVPPIYWQLRTKFWKLKKKTLIWYFYQVHTALFHQICFTGR